MKHILANSTVPTVAYRNQTNHSDIPAAKIGGSQGADFEPSPVRKQIIELLDLRRPKSIHHPVD